MERLKVENNMCFGSNDRTSAMAINITIKVNTEKVISKEERDNILSIMAEMYKYQYADAKFVEILKILNKE